MTNLSEIDAVEIHHFVMASDPGRTECDVCRVDEAEGMTWYGEPWFEIMGHLRDPGGIDDLIRFNAGTSVHVVHQVAAIIERAVGEPRLHNFQEFHPDNPITLKEEQLVWVRGGKEGEYTVVWCDASDKHELEATEE